MSVLALLLVLVAVALLAAAVVVVVRRDGYGTLEPPRSHPDDADAWAGVGLPPRRHPA